MKIPQTFLKLFDEATNGVRFGRVSLSAVFRNGRPYFEVAKNQTFQETDAESVESDFYFMEGNRKPRRKN